jgi:hypothetical protein
MFATSVVDPHHFDADPDANPDSTCHAYVDPNADPDSNYHPDVDPDPDSDFYLMWIGIQILASK